MSAAIGVVSFSAAAAAYALLTLLLAVGCRRRAIGLCLIAASVATGLWATILAIQSATASIPVPAIYLAEVLVNGAWLVVLFDLVRQRLSKWLWYVGLVLGAASIGAGLSTMEEDASVLIVPRATLVMTLIGLVLIGQVYRNALLPERPAIRYFAMGLGGVFAFNLLASLHAEILHAVPSATWDARGAVAALAAPLIAVAARRHPKWSFNIFVSRQVVFYTTIALIVGAYLFAVTAASFVVEDLAGASGAIAQIAFIVGAVLLLVVLVASSAVRRHLAVFINKHFYSNKYDYRIEWLRFIETLSSIEDGDARRTGVRAVAQILGSPGALLFTKESGSRRFVPVASWPMKVDQVTGLDAIDANSDIIHFLADKQWIIDLDEYRISPSTYQNIALPTWLLETPHLRIVSPMLQLNELVGFFVLYDPPAPFKLTFEDRDLLKTVGRHVATQLAQHEADRRLAESRQFETYNRLTAFIMHDLKNAVAQLQLIVANASRHKSNPEFIDDSIATIDNTVQRMTRLIEQISSSGDAARLDEISLGDVVRSAVQRCSQREPAPSVVGDAADDVVVRAHPERLTAVLEHVIRNAQDAAVEGTTVILAASRTGGEVTITVEDTGRGMDPEFVRERLFRPFDSTKGPKGMGIGAYQVREYVQMLGGRVEVQSSPGVGTRFSIILPIEAELSARSVMNG